MDPETIEDKAMVARQVKGNNSFLARPEMDEAELCDVQSSKVQRCDGYKNSSILLLSCALEATIATLGRSDLTPEMPRKMGS